MEGFIILELDFKELEQFKTPDGEVYEINPLDVKDIRIVFEFLQAQDELKAIKETNDTLKANALIFGNKEMEEPSMIELANSIIDKSITNTETGDLLPKKYRTAKKLLQLSGHVAIATMDLNNQDIERAGGNPLELQKMLSDKSKETSSPSKKKDGRQRKS